MVFNLLRASSIPTMVPYNPDPVPGYTWAPDGFWFNFTSDSHIDASHSLNYVLRENGRSMVSPSRSQGGNHLAYQFHSLSGWTLIQTGSASAHLAVSADGWPTLISRALVLTTNGSLGSVAGVQTTLPTVPTSFSFATVFYAPNGSAADALHYMVQNNDGLVLWVRLYNGVAEVWADGAWHNIGTIGFGPLGPQLSECWVECHYNGPGSGGTRTVSLYGGCQKYGEYTGTVFPYYQLPANNMCGVSQQSGANPNRMGMLLSYFIGPTQLPDNFTYCSPAFSTATSPTNGHLMLSYENVSRDIVLGGNLKAFITKADLAPWIEVPLTVQGVVGKGELDVTADVISVCGDVAFPAGSGAAMRAYVSSDSGAFPVLQGLTMFWD